MNTDAVGYAVTVPAEVAAEMRLKVRAGEYDTKRLQLVLCHRLGTWVPQAAAEALYESYLEGDL